MLDTASRFRKVLKREEKRIKQIINSEPERISGICGAVSLAAAFAIYLGPYHHNFRRNMLTEIWPNCLRERGIVLSVDSIHEIKGTLV